MDPKDVMKGSPPTLEAQVTRANWRTFPAIRWSFRNVRQLLPTAEIRRARRPSELPSAAQDLSRLTVAQPDGTRTTLAEIRRETFADALVVLHRGRIVTEWYGDGMTPATQHLVCSVSKSICGTLSGILIGRR
jgi:CubicO group peptidase (beta-lactamase class C family)